MVGAGALALSGLSQGTGVADLSLSAAPARAAAPSPTCPATWGTTIGGPAARPAARKVLVPSGANAVLACRFGLGGPTHATARFGLTAAGLTTSDTEIGKITDGLDAIPARRHLICPDDEVLGAEIVTFYYRSGPPVLLSLDLGGCLLIRNGSVTRPGLDSPAVAEIGALLRSVKAGVIARAWQGEVRPNLGGRHDPSTHSRRPGQAAAIRGAKR